MTVFGLHMGGGRISLISAVQEVAVHPAVEMHANWRQV